MNRKIVCSILVLGLCLLVGCSSVDEYLANSMLQKSGVYNGDDYAEYKQLADEKLIGTDGYYVDSEGDIGTTENYGIKVTFAENKNLIIKYYSDKLCLNEIESNNYRLNQGEAIYATVDISNDVISSMYTFSGFEIYEYPENGVREKSSLVMQADEGIYVLNIPDNYEVSDISIEPIGEYIERTITLRDFYKDDNGQELDLKGEWVVNDKVYTTENIEISPITSYIISYQFDSEEFFLLSSEPECYYYDEYDGIVIFKQREAEDETEDYSVELHKYIPVSLISDVKRHVIVNGSDRGEVGANAELQIGKAKYGDTIIIETDQEWKGLEKNRELILTQTENISKNEYRYTFIVPEEDGVFTFDPNEYSYDYGRIRFRCFGQTVISTQVLAKGSRIYYEEEYAFNGYWLAGDEADHYIVVEDEETTKAALRSIHFTPKVSVSLMLPQPASGGSVEYSLNGSRIFGTSCSTYSGAIVTMKLKPWEGWISQFAGEVTYNVGDTLSQTVTVNGTDVDKVFYEDEGHKPVLNVKLDKTVGDSMEFSVEASGVKVDKVHFDKDSKDYSFFDNEHTIVKNEKIGTDKPIQLSMSNRAIQSGKALKVLVEFTDDKKNKSESEIYIDDISQEIDPIFIYDPNSRGTSVVWYKSIDVTISVVDIRRHSIPTAGLNSKIEVLKTDTGRILSDNEFIEDSTKVTVVIVPADGYYISGKKITNDYYSDTMKYSEYLKNIGGIITDHPAKKYIQVHLDKTDTYAQYTYKLDGKEVSGALRVKEGQKLELTYEITDTDHKLKEPAGGIVFDIGSSETKAKKTIIIDNSFDGHTITKQSFGIETL